MGILSWLFGKSEVRKAADGTVFRDATKDRVIIETPGYKPSVGHPKKSPEHRDNKK